MVGQLLGYCLIFCQALQTWAREQWPTEPASQHRVTSLCVCTLASAHKRGLCWWQMAHWTRGGMGCRHLTLPGGSPQIFHASTGLGVCPSCPTTHVALWLFLLPEVLLPPRAPVTQLRLLPRGGVRGISARLPDASSIMTPLTLGWNCLCGSLSFGELGAVSYSSTISYLVLTERSC